MPRMSIACGGLRWERERRAQLDEKSVAFKKRVDIFYKQPHFQIEPRVAIKIPKIKKKMCRRKVWKLLHHFQ